VLVGLILLCALGTAALAAPMQCPEDNLTTYLTPGFACTQNGGITTFQSFVFTPQGSLTADDITLTPLDILGGFGFLLHGNFVVGPGVNESYVLSYFVDPPPIIHGEQIDLDPFGSVSLITDLCITEFPCAPANSLGKLTATTANTMASIMFPSSQATLGVQNTLTLNGGTSGANSQGFDNITLIPADADMPEPSTILLSASGLLGLLAFRSRAKLRKIRF